MPRWIDAEKAEIHAIRFFLEIDATGKCAGFLENQKLAGAEIFQRAFVIDAIASNKRTFDFKRGVDELRQRVGVRILSDAKRKCYS